MKTTAITPSNIAFIKYWGKKDEALRLPENGSISMNLSNLLTTTTVEFSSQYKEDSVIINGVQEPNEGSRAIKHLDRIRKLANISDKAKVVTENNFPTGTGLSSSASGFAALTVAPAKAPRLTLSEKDLPLLVPYDILYHAFRARSPVSPAEHLCHRAEVAVIRAAPRSQ